MKKKKVVTSLISQKKFQGLVLVMCLLVMFLIGFKPLSDPDMGWHLRAGADILERSEVPKIDWYTHSFSDFKWVNHEWLSDVIVYSLYNIGGPLLLSFIFWLLVVIVFLFILPRAAGSCLPRVANWIIGTIGFFFVYPFLGVRMQILTLLGVSLLLLFWRYLHQKPNSKIVFFLPFFFILWANLHAGFFIGLVMLSILVVFELVKRQSLKSYGSSWLVSERFTLPSESLSRLIWIIPITLGATFINPYGYRIYEEIFRTVFDNYGTREINEWLSPNASSVSGIIFLLYLSFFLIVLFFRRGCIGLNQFVLFLLFLLAAFFSQRNIPLFVVVTLPYFFQNSQKFFQDFILPVLRRKSVIVALVVLILTLSAQYFYKQRDFEDFVLGIDKLDIYPIAALDYIKSNPLSGNMLNEYNWGGFLIWAYPETKVFTDGRTPHWRQGESQLLYDFNSLVRQEGDVAELLDQYEIDYVLLFPERPLLNYLQREPGWEEVYRDDKAVIVKSKNP